jgi:16S rRNA (uracil1498-N3)-methyltransferase
VSEINPMRFNDTFLYIWNKDYKIMHLFYAPDINEDFYLLSEEESKHCSRVLRLKAGDKIYLTNGKGTLYSAVLEKIEIKSILIKIIEVMHEYQKLSYHLHIGIAPTKNSERFEWFLEKATEIGINEITPLIVEHSERTIIKNERLERVIISAMKQSLKTYKPKLNPILPLNSFLEANFSDSQKYIAHCHGKYRQLLKNVYLSGKDVVILIGPEGDFSMDEIEEAIKKGFQPISMGESRLRSETAGIVACYTINLLNQHE